VSFQNLNRFQLVNSKN